LNGKVFILCGLALLLGNQVVAYQARTFDQAQLLTLDAAAMGQTTCVRLMAERREALRRQSDDAGTLVQRKNQLQPAEKNALDHLSKQTDSKYLLTEIHSFIAALDRPSVNDGQLNLSLMRTTQEFRQYIADLMAGSKRKGELFWLLQVLTAIGGFACLLQGVRLGGLSAVSGAKLAEQRNLAILADNVRRAARSQPLNPPLASNDEWAEIDEALHSLCHAVQAQEEFRRAALASVSHDIRSPLSSIRLFMELLAEGSFGKLSAAGVERTSRTLEILSKLNKLTDDLLDAEKTSFESNLSIETVNLAGLIKEAIQSMQGPAHARKVTIRLDEGNSELMVPMDQRRILQVVWNLLSNAIKFSPRDSSVQVVIDRPSAEVCQVSVIDSGPGISVLLADRLFAKFENEPTTSSYKGYGLGLNIAKSVVEQHGGTIGYENLSSGTRFWFTLPMER
jgi:signal transduction histidine kinase